MGGGTDDRQRTCNGNYGIDFRLPHGFSLFFFRSHRFSDPFPFHRLKEDQT